MLNLPNFTLQAIVAGATLLATAAEQPYNAGFEADPKRADTWSGMTLSSEQPRSGRSCGLQTGKFRNGWNVCRNCTNIKCEPNTRYRIKAWVRSTMKDGVIFLGAREIALVEKDKTLRYFSKALPDVSSEWKQYQAEFTTHATTKVFQVYTKISAASPDGKVFWDDFSVEKITEKPNMLTIQKFPASVTFVNQDNLVSFGNPSKLAALDPSEALRVSFSKAPAGASLVLTFNGEKIKRSVSDSGETEFDLHWNKLPEGRYTAKVELVDSSGKCLDSAEHLILRLRAPEPFKFEPVKKVTAGGPNRLFYVNGKPFFPVFFCHVPQDPNTYSALRENFGINTTFVWLSPSGKNNDEKAEKFISTIKKYLDNCQRGGIYGIVVMEGLDAKRAENGIDPIMLKKVVAGLKDHPALFMWRLKDEPDGSSRCDADAMLKSYQVIKEIDSNHPVVTNFCNEQLLQKYVKTSDFGSYDHYPYPTTSMLAMREFSRLVSGFYSEDKPLFNYMQFWGEGQKVATMPPYQWLKANFYLALITGTRSLSVYSWDDPKPSECICCDREAQGNLKALVVKFADMRDFLTLPAEKTDMRLPDFLQLRLNKHGLLLVNPTEDTLTVRLKLKHQQLFDEYGQKLTPDRNGIFSLELIPYHAMFYRFK